MPAQHLPPTETETVTDTTRYDVGYEDLASIPHSKLSPLQLSSKEINPPSPPSPPSSQSSIAAPPPSAPSSPSAAPPHPNHPNPAFPAYAPLLNTPFVRLLRATAGDDWATVLQSCQWRPWFYYVQGFISYLTIVTMPLTLAFIAKQPTMLQLLSIIPMTITLIGVNMSICLHRYFAHKAFLTSRPFQFVLCVMGCLAFQNGPLWWAGKHARHHKFCDTPMDPHSWCQRGFFYAWVGWTCSGAEYHLDQDFIAKSFLNTPELRFLDLYWSLPVVAANLAVWKLSGSFETMLYCLYIPMILCRLITLFFNTSFHPTRSLAKCKAIDLGTDWMGRMVGEAYHKHHHYHPRAAQRPGLDLPWRLVLRWWAAAGLVWDVKL